MANSLDIFILANSYYLLLHKLRKRIMEIENKLDEMNKTSKEMLEVMKSMEKNMRELKIRLIDKLG